MKKDRGLIDVADYNQIMMQQQAQQMRQLQRQAQENSSQ
jgi:hypothetical protein